MPANKKYLSSNGQRFLKISAGVLGGLSITVLFHNAIASLLIDKDWLITTSAYSSFIIWALLVILAFMSKNGWKIWGIYLFFIMAFSLIIYLS